MKILHVILSVASVRGGPSQAVIEMVAALRSQGVDAEIATTNDNGEKLLDVPLYELTDYQAEYANVPIRFFPKFSPNKKVLRGFCYSGALTVWLWQNISKYDVVHVHGIFSYVATIAMAIARIKKVPYINRPFGQLCQWSLQQSKWRKQIYLNLIERANLQHCQFLHFTSQQEQEEFKQLGLNIPSFVLPHGVNMPDLIPDARDKIHQILQIPNHCPIILFLSRIHHKKGLEYLIAALDKLKAYDFALAIAGSGATEYVTQIKDLLEAYNLSDRTHFVGFVKGATKNLYLQGADLFALTSHSENFGIAVVESLAAATPVLITDQVPIATIVQKYEIGYVTKLDVEAIAIALEVFLQDFNKDFNKDPNKAHPHFQKFQQVIQENYSWVSISLQLTKIYESLCP